MIKRIIGWLVLVPLCVLLIVFALANRQYVSVHFDPLSAQNPLVPNLDMPLFVLIYSMLILGVVLGGIATWLSQGHYRRDRRHLQRDKIRLERELETARRQPAVNPDLQKGLVPADDFADID